MYEGSMRGRGSCFFAVWGYVISHFMPDRQVGAQVDLNPEIIGFLIGEDVDKIRAVIDEMCQPDPHSRSKEKEGRKLIKLGEYSYQVVNGEKYHEIRNEERRREQNREAQKRFRNKNQKHAKSETLPKPGDTGA